MNITESFNTATLSTTLKDVPFGFHATGIFGKHEFVQIMPWAAVPVIVMLVVASCVGTIGNVLTLLAIAWNKSVRNVESMFIVNLAISDLYVTTVADPISLIAKLEGEHFFDRIPRLCQVIAKLCTISCVTSLLTIATMSINRYLFVCHNHLYRKIFSKRTSITICVSVYCVGLVLVLLNQAGIGDHGFDRKSLDCIWDRMATYPYTVVYSVTLVWIPSIVIGICYLRLYVYVQGHKKKMNNYNKRTTTVSSGNGLPPKPKLQLAKTFILIYCVFVTCWVPYALLMVIDHQDAFLHEIHVYLTVWAHMHPSINWLIYYYTQPKFAAAYRKILTCGFTDSTRNVPDPPSRENSSDRQQNDIRFIAIHEPVMQMTHHRPDKQQELIDPSESYCMEWKPIAKTKSEISSVDPNNLHENNNGNGIYRKLYEEIRHIHSEGEIQIFVRDCSIKANRHTKLQASQSEDLTKSSENDRTKFRGSGRGRKFALADGVQEMQQHSNAIIELIDRVCDSQSFWAPCAVSNEFVEICKACEYLHGNESGAEVMEANDLKHSCKSQGDPSNLKSKTAKGERIVEQLAVPPIIPPHSSKEAPTMDSSVMVKYSDNAILGENVGENPQYEKAIKSETKRDQINLSVVSDNEVTESGKSQDKDNYNREELETRHESESSAVTDVQIWMG